MDHGRQRNLGQSARDASESGPAGEQRRDPAAHDPRAPAPEAGPRGADGDAHVGGAPAATQGRATGWRAGRGNARLDHVGQHPGQDRPADPPDRAAQDPDPDVLTNGLGEAGPGFRVYRNARDSSAGAPGETPARTPAPRPSAAAPVPPRPKAAPPKPAAAPKQRPRSASQVPGRPDGPGEALTAAMNRSRNLDERAKATLTTLTDRMKEWHRNDYIPDEDLEAFDESSLKLAGELLQADAPEFGQLNEYDVTAPGQSAQDIEHAILPENEVRFGDFIEKKRQQYNGTDDSGITIPPAAEEDHTRRLFDDHGDQHDTTETRELPKNIIKIEDPEDALGRQDTGVLKPADIQERFLAPGVIRDDNPGKFLTNPAMLQLSSVRNFSAWINRYRLMRDKEFWTEKQLLEDFCEVALKYVNKKYAFHRLPSALRFVFFVENPLFVFCVFSRCKDKENKKYLKPGETDLKPAHRKYAWAGHLFCIGRDGTNDPVQLPPSTFQFKPPAAAPPSNLYSNESGRSGPRPNASQNDGWE